MNHRRHNMFNKCLVSIASYRNNCIFCYWILPFGLNRKKQSSVRLVSRSRLWLLGHEPRRSPPHYKPLSSIWWSSEDLPRMSLTMDLSFLEAYSCYLLNQFFFSYLSFSVLLCFLYFQNVMLPVESWGSHTENHLRSQQRKSKIEQLLCIIK